ncbi:DNA recombination protein RmuC [Candidatus Enterovibrio altilux]|uniref:DNA recombination protein RmuC n=1 Tax=Candidatus Enterovibrio altilux TaxID=1927128 RepID=A0A291B8F9_9GAMM|nr:DNA recombination protein RmuC [Candidatus Enterovibrio luxaltus]ATF09286.1 DNA recombination protein RmuC [Candidatus Enterovibrio luxaltus]
MQIESLLSDGILWIAAGAGASIIILLGMLFHRMAQKNLHDFMTQKSDADSKVSQAVIEHLQLKTRTLKYELDGMNLEHDRLNNELRNQYGKLSATAEKLCQMEVLRLEKERLVIIVETLRNHKSALELSLREQQTRTQAQLEAADAKIRILEGAEERLHVQFESLANKVFDHKTKTVDEQNRQSLNSLLGPLKSQIEGFHKQVSDSFGEQAKERHTLIHEIESLQKLNKDMTREAVNLTQALKGDNKQQGNWGEIILARVLKESGLREGHEYQAQVSLENEQGKRYQPDVIVHLPHGKDVVIDAKMALVAYERYYHAETSMDKDSALREHVASIRGHIRELGRKDYHHLHGIHSLDYVLMFIPVEPAFQIMIVAEPSLIREALDHNIMLVSPTTLLVALRTINNLWRYEHQNKNAHLIADKAAKLYNKIRLFVVDMEMLGSALDKASNSYQGALNKLSTGRGNILRQAEGFRSLGVETKREINPTILNRNASEEIDNTSAMP